MFFMEQGIWSWQYVYEQSLPTVGGTSTYSVSALKINSLYSTNPNRRLKPIEDRAFRRFYPNPTLSGTPYLYRRMGRSTATADTLKIGLYPVPDGVYALKWDGILPITLLTSDSQDVRTTTGMPSTIVNLLIDLAVAIGFGQNGDSDENPKLQEVLARLESAYAQDNYDIDDSMVMAPLEAEDLNRYYDPALPPDFGE
jgi:hypothetical protein